jgi:hypothetical protein
MAAQGATGNGTSPIICDATVNKCANVVTTITGLNAPVVAGHVGSVGSVQAVACDQNALVSITSATTTTIVPTVSGKSVYVCGFFFDKASGAGTTFKFVYGTKVTTECDTGQVAISPAMDGAAQWITIGTGLGILFHTPASQELCIVTVGGSSDFEGVLSYAQF